MLRRRGTLGGGKGRVCLLAAGALALLAFGWPSAAMPEKDRILAPGRLKVEGRAMRCGGAPTLMSRTFWDYGGSHRGMIILNPDKLETLAPAVRLFVYAHECGHHIFGASEIKADCYAVQRGRREGWLTQEGLAEICHFFRDHPGDWVHPPGPQRCAYMTRCFAGETPARVGRGASSLGPAE